MKIGNRLENVVKIPPDQAQDEMRQTSGHSIERGKKYCLLKNQCKPCKFLLSS